MDEILAKYFSGEASDQEKLEVESWRGESRENGSYFLDTKQIWLAAAEELTPDAGMLDEILDPVKELKEPILLRSWVKYASAAVLVLALGFLFFLNEFSSTGSTIEKLSDGTEVFLHEESSITLSRFDEDIREIVLEGKAYFDVAREEDRPFSIITENALIKVLGTSFVVDTYEGRTEVSVESGIVEVTKKSGLSVILEKGDVAVITKTNQGILKMPNSDTNYLAWKTRKIVFEESSMEDVKKVLEDVYGVEITFTDATFSECSYTATLERKKLEDILEIISRTFDIEYDFDENKAVFKGKGC